MDESAPSCRIAFHGRVLSFVDTAPTGFEHTTLRVFKVRVICVDNVIVCMRVSVCCL